MLYKIEETKREMSDGNAINMHSCGGGAGEQPAVILRRRNMV